jgi:hypothetical protein
MKMQFADDVIAKWRRPPEQSPLNCIVVFLFFLLSSCAPTPQPEEQVIVTAYATPAATPWLADLYACAKNSNVVINFSAESPDISLWVGEPEAFTSPVYQIGEEEILIVTGSDSPLAELTLEEAQTIFAQGNPSGQAWVYPSDADVQMAFDQLVMKGRSVNSFARVAVSPQMMSDVLKSEANSVGILPRRWVAGDMRELFSAGRVPVLAVTTDEPQGVVKQLLSCLQY